MTDRERAAYYAATGHYEDSKDRASDFDAMPEPSDLYLSRRLECGHVVSASEDSGGMDELPRVTAADVQRLLDFKIATHDCERFEVAERIRAEGRPFG